MSKEYLREWSKRNKEKVKLYHQRYKEKHPEKYKEIHKNWKKNNPELELLCWNCHMAITHYGTCPHKSII